MALTNLEALRANLSDAHGLVLLENHFLKALADVGLAANDTYSSAGSIDSATLKLYDVLLATASFSEGALSYNLNLAELRKLRDTLAESLGSTLTGRNITSPLVW